MVESVYESVAVPGRWRDVLEQLRGLTGAAAGLLFTPDLPVAGGGLGLGANIDPAQHGTYEAHYRGKDPWLAAALERGLNRTGMVLTGEMLVDDRAFGRSEFFNDFLEPVGLGRVCSLVVHDGRAPDAPCSHLSLYRPFTAEPFDDRASGLLDRLQEHLRRAVALHARLQHGPNGWSSILLDHLPWAAFLVDARQQVRHANLAGRALLDGRDGLTLQQGRLVASARSEARRLDGILARTGAGVLAAAGRVGGDMLLTRPSGRCPLLLSVVPLPRPGAELLGAGAVRAVVYVSDPELLPADAELRLGQLLDLTQAERRIARGLLEGLTVAEIALRSGVARETVRSQLRSLLAKTGTNRQSELVLLLQRILAMPGDGQPPR